MNSKSNISIARFLSYLCLACLLTNISCKKFVTVGPPVSMISAGSIFTNDATATSSIVGLYSQIVSVDNYILNGAMSIYGSLSADDLITPVASSQYDPFLNNELDSKLDVIETSYWKPAYSYIFQANAIIEGLTSPNGVTPATKAQLIGEAKFIRALCYFYLEQVYGAVPLVTNTDFAKNNLVPRTASALVIQQVITDLKDAQSLLTDQYATTASYPAARTRANLWAATALLARVYLYQKDYPDAEAQSSAIIASGTYSLEDDLTRVFLATSREAILQFQPTGADNTGEGNIFIPSAGSAPNFALTPVLLNAFEAGDLRFFNWVQTINAGGTEYAYPFKYRVASGGAPYTEYIMILRYAEQFLIHAEAAAQQNKEEEALGDLNTIRARAGLAALPDTLNQAQIILAVEQERRIEFFAESGHRWFDLKRTGRADSVLGPLKGIYWQPADTLYPIPYGEMQLNPALIQNAGYN